MFCPTKFCVRIVMTLIVNSQIIKFTWYSYSLLIIRDFSFRVNSLCRPRSTIFVSVCVLYRTIVLGNYSQTISDTSKSNMEDMVLNRCQDLSKLLSHNWGWIGLARWERKPLTPYCTIECTCWNNRPNNFLEFKNYKIK